MDDEGMIPDSKTSFIILEDFQQSVKPISHSQFKLVYPRRFSFSDKILDFDSEDILSQCKPIVYVEKDGLLDKYIEEEPYNFSPSLEQSKQLGSPPNFSIKSHDLELNLIEENRKEPETLIAISKLENNNNNINLICNCKKSKCLKLYCECFAIGKMCDSKCNCFECYNNINNILVRDLAIKTSNKKEIEKKDKSIVKNGCNCKKSHCKKKYCECFDVGKECTENCSCEGCRNGLKNKKKDKKIIKRKRDKIGRIKPRSKYDFVKRINLNKNKIFKIVSIKR